jgi:hypothetical protein
MSRTITCHGLLTALLAMAATHCGGAGFARTSAHEGDWKAVADGKDVLLYAGANKCERTKIGASMDELKSGRGKPLAAEPWSQSVSSWKITESYAEDVGDYGPDVYLHLKESGGSKDVWLYSQTSSTLGCVHPGTPDVAEAQKLLGKRYAFTPQRASCQTISAGGSAFEGLVGAAPAGKTFEATRVGLGPDGVFVGLDGGALQVTPDTLSSCFAPEGSPEAKAPEELSLALLRVNPGRCERDVFDGKVHAACRSTLGAWQDKGGELHSIRRTFGPLHLLDGQPVAGRRFARAVVAIDTGLAQNQREVSLYQALRSAATRIIEQGDDSVRIAPTTDPAVTTRVKIVVKNIVIGDLQTSQKKETSKYKVSERQVPNTEKAGYESQLRDAEQQVQSKQSECDSMPDSDYSASQACVDRCVAESGGMAAATCGFTCKDAGSNADKDNCNAAVSQAQGVLNDLRSRVNSMPDTLTETVWGDWEYTRTDYARKVTAAIETISLSAMGERRASDDLDFTASDHQITADPAHNVSGHDPRRDFIDSPESIVPSLAEKASAVAIERLKQSIQVGAVDAALLALKKSGATPKPGYEGVDAMAYDVVGKRLGKSETYAEGVGALDLGWLSLGSGECVLVAALSSDAGSGVGLKSADGRFADERKRPFATLELCAGELAGGKVPNLELSGKDVKYGVYRTRESE